LCFQSNDALLKGDFVSAPSTNTFAVVFVVRQLLQNQLIERMMDEQLSAPNALAI